MSTSINISSSGIETRFAQDSVTSNVYYCGTARKGTLDSVAEWVIERLTVSVNGDVLAEGPATANPPTYTVVSWDNRENLNY